ncbi:ATP-dependent helicase [Methanocella sp. CWC-04]|uniref:DNA 3'-5' helicase n=1 Tax=Methanooceanicella nereidis TaxID=2052831 RepID=A0AAP2RAR5_9EURY|nr:ATP-dependent DNA helicase [Methanocella sp. CWC-04]MCD1293873.1 ATP-dependent helicase [Methanocella sp. CWC-04]
MDFFESFREITGRILNNEQKQAIMDVEGPVLVTAGAGTGKTTMITAKTAYLIKEKKLKPERLLMLTFSREAAGHMKDELVKVVPEGRDVYANTFHAFCSKFLRDNSDTTGITDDHKILDETDAKFLLFKELDVPAYKIGNYITSIQRAKDLDLYQHDFEEYISGLESQLKGYYSKKSDLETEVYNARFRIKTLHLDVQTKELREEKKRLNEFLALYDEYEKYVEFLKAWKGYEEKKAEKKMLDYADLIKLTLEYASDIDDEVLADLYDYVIVDEFQDTNRQQFKLLKILTSKCKNITVVGDENQAIYAFRGAYPENIGDFKKELKAKEYKLIENYRSTDTILRTAHRLIVNNYDDPEDTPLLRSANNTEGDKVRLISLKNPNEQARRIVEEVELLVNNGIKHDDIAVLFRSHSSASMIQTAFQRRGVPFQLVSNTGFLKRQEIRTALAYLYVIANLENPRYSADQQWWSLLHYKYGLSMSDSHVLAKAAKRGSIQNVMMGALPSGLSKEGRNKIRLLLAKIQELRNNKNKPLQELLLDIYDVSGLSRQFSHEATIDNRLSMLNLKHLYDVILEFQEFYGTDLPGFIEYMEMLDELGDDLESPQIEDAHGVVLMTCHAAKGLEFDHVYIADLVESKFPITSGGREPLIPDEMNDRYKAIFEAGYGSEKEMEEALKARKKELRIKEERRLAYVAYTRAKKVLNLCYARSYGDKERDPSEFIDEACYENDELHKDVEFVEDITAIVVGMDRDSDLDRKKAEIKNLLLANMDSDPELALYNLLLYQSLSGNGHSINIPEAKTAAEEAGIILSNISDGIPRGLKFVPEEFKLSFSALKTYRECPKKFELSYVLRMPSRDDDSEGDSALGFGSFVHEVLELAVKNKVNSREDIDKIAKDLAKMQKYNGVNIKRANLIFDVFWARNKDRMSNNLMTEQMFNFVLDGYHFTGKIDRIDRIGSNGDIEIIDYKTGKEPAAVDRDSQLVVYKLAFENDPALKALGYNPKRLTLELLEDEVPRVFEVSDDGCMKNVNGRCKAVKIEDTLADLLKLADGIKNDYEKGFNVIENCGGNTGPGRYCPYQMYCPKWS